MENIERTIDFPADFKTYVREWIPSTVKSTVVLVHGLGEHICRYEHVSAMLNREGAAVLGFDLPGHGKTSGKLGHIPSIDLVMDTIERLLDEAAQRFPGVPHFLYGHSLGANLVLNTYLTRKPALSGVIATSPMLGQEDIDTPAWKIAAAKVLNVVAPAVTLENGINADHLSTDPSVALAYRSDPLVHPMISARLGMDLLKSGKRIVSQAEACPRVPLLLMVGSHDKLVNPGAVDAYAKKCSAPLTYKMWDGMYHELHNEVKKEEVFQFMVEWMERQGSVTI